MTDPTPLMLMDRLLDALKEAGIGWCQRAFFRDDSGSDVKDYNKALRVCMHGAMNWGLYTHVLSVGERDILRHSLKKASSPRSVITLNDCSGWDFARFREELAKREGDERRQ